MSALRTSPQRRQRGVAFVIVIWLMALLTILLGAFALMARVEGKQARHHYDAAVARHAAAAGINEAVYFLAQPDPTQKWIPDGRAYQFDFEDMQIQVEITDESGLVDINAADIGFLTELFTSLGVEMNEAAALAAAIQDWRDADDLLSPEGAELPEYEAAGLDYGPANAPFSLVSELLQVLGMTPALYERLRPLVTIYSGRPRPDLAYAPPEVIQAMPNMTAELAQQIVEMRRMWDPNSGAPAPRLPDGTELMARGGTGTYTLKSRATLPNGAWTQLDATIRMGGGLASGLAYTALRWQDGEPETSKSSDGSFDSSDPQDSR